MKKIICLVVIFITTFTYSEITVFAAINNYNVADFSSASFNNWNPIDTWNQAWVIVEDTWTYSWTILVSDASYNIAGISSEVVNQWLPINTPKKAKVTIDKTIWVSENQNLENDVSYNIADFSSASFNNGNPINTWKKAKVIVDADMLYQPNEDSFIYWDTFYNVADFSSASFNNWQAIDTWKQAKVMISLISWSDWELTVNRDSNYNIAWVQSEDFNNWLPITTPQKAKVNFEKVEDYYETQIVDSSITDEITYTDLTSDKITDGFSKVYSNSLNYIMSAVYPNWKWINLQNQKSEIYNLTGQNGAAIIWDYWLYQKIIDRTPDDVKLDFENNNSIIISDWALYHSNSSILQVDFRNDLVMPPVLTYPFMEIKWEWDDKTETYELNTNYPIIKWMAFPNSILEVNISSETYYVKVNEKWLFEFNSWKKIENGEIDIIFQYKMLEWNDNLSTYANKKLLSPKKYSINVNWSNNYSFPYITSMYNDDTIYWDIIHLEWFANPWNLNYSILELDWTNILSGETVVDNITKKFSFMVWNKTSMLSEWNYIVEVWQNWWLKERKAFKVVKPKNNIISIINIKDFDIVPTKIPTFVWYSKENIINNDTIRVYACDITWSTWLKPCEEENRKFVWTANASANGFFNFTPLEPLEDEKYYEFEFFNTNSVTNYKKVVVKIDTNSSIFNSQTTSIFSWLNINNNYIEIEWFSVPWANISIWVNQTIANENWIFKLKIPIVENFDIIFEKSWDIYTKKYKIYKSQNNINNSDKNYYQYFNYNDFNVIDF